MRMTMFMIRNRVKMRLDAIPSDREKDHGVKDDPKDDDMNADSYSRGSGKELRSRYWWHINVICNSENVCLDE